MLTKTKSGLFVLIVVASFLIISVAIGALSPETSALGNNGEQPVQPATAAQDTYAAQPAMGETIREASLNWADFGEEPKLGATAPQPFMGDRLYEASLNWADYSYSEETGSKSRLPPRPPAGAVTDNKPY